MARVRSAAIPTIRAARTAFDVVRDMVNTGQLEYTPERLLRVSTIVMQSVPEVGPAEEPTIAEEVRVL